MIVLVNGTADLNPSPHDERTSMLAFVAEFLWATPLILLVAVLAAAKPKSSSVRQALLICGGALLGLLYAILLAGVFGPAVSAVPVPLLLVMVVAGASTAVFVVSLRSRTLSKSSAATYVFVIAFSLASYFYLRHVVDRRSAVRLVILQGDGAGKELTWRSEDTELTDREKQLVTEAVPYPLGVLIPVYTQESGTRPLRTVIVVFEKAADRKAQFRLPDAGIAVVVQDLNGEWRFTSTSSKAGTDTVTVSPASGRHAVLVEVETPFAQIGTEVGELAAPGRR